MSQQKWRTKEDVLEDLTKVTGSKISGIDNHFFLCGEGPPPPLDCDDDDSQYEYFGVKKDKLPLDTCMEPDLKGIMQMIKMVNHFETITEKKEKPTLPKDNLVISKLNPNVPDFIPKVSNNFAKDPSPIIVDKVEKVDKNDANDTNNTENDSQGPRITDKEREEIVNELKKKINNVSPSDYHVKKERNLAMASLLKLYSRKPTPNSNTLVKLVTPEYFEKGINDKGNVLTEQTKPQTSTTTSDSTIDKDMSTTDKCDEMANVTLSKNIPEVYTPDHEIQNSIRKVNNWLNPPPKESKPPVIYLGQVAFKRKDPGTSKSPNGSTQKVAKPTTKQCASYKPSKYADDLGKLYLERSKLKESLEQDIWSKLQSDLKARDEVIKKRMAEKEVSDQATDVQQVSTTEQDESNACNE